MGLGLLALRLLLAGVLLVAGVAKLADRAGSAQAVRDFGITERLAPAMGTLLPLAEIVVGLGLLPRPTAWLAALAALALLVVFLAGMGYNLARGRAPECHCFGQLHSEPVSWRSIARNAVLALAAVALLVLGYSDPGVSLVGWTADLTTAEAVLLGLVALLGVGLAGEGAVVALVLKQNGRLLARLETLESKTGASGAGGSGAIVAPAGLPVGTVAPGFSVSDLRDETQTLDGLRARGKPIVLVFGDASCGSCSALLPDIARYQRDYESKLTIALVTRGAREANRAKAAQHGLDLVLLQEDREVAAVYLVRGTPSAVLIRMDGTVGSALAEGADQVRSLVALAVGLPALVPGGAAPSPTAAQDIANRVLPMVPFAFPQLPGLFAAQGAIAAAGARVKAGDAVPSMRLHDVDGVEHDLDEFRGRETLLLFWRSTCGFCQRMVKDLLAWEANLPEGAPRLILVATDSAEANRSLGLQSLVLLDPEFRLGQACGVRGTPTGVLMDADGRVATDLAMGSPAVLRLLGVSQHAA